MNSNKTLLSLLQELDDPTAALFAVETFGRVGLDGSSELKSGELGDNILVHSIMVTAPAILTYLLGVDISVEQYREELVEIATKLAMVSFRIHKDAGTIQLFLPDTLEEYLGNIRQKLAEEFGEKLAGCFIEYQALCLENKRVAVLECLSGGDGDADTMRVALAALLSMTPELTADMSDRDSQGYQALKAAVLG